MSVNDDPLQITEHFQLGEFELDGPMPAECVEPYTELAKVLELFRAQFSEPIDITSGYRTPESNDEAHGKLHSQHMATADYCAADWYFPSMLKNMRPAFDWVRQQATVVWDQCTLEHDLETGNDIVHLSWSKTPRREALEGQMFNAGPYKQWAVVPYQQS